MTEIQMFSDDGARRSQNKSRSSQGTTRPSFKNPYVDPDSKTQGTNNTSGIKNSAYSSGVKYNQGIKYYEQNVSNEGVKDEPLYPTIEKFEENSRNLETINEDGKGSSSVTERRYQPT